MKTGSAPTAARIHLLDLEAGNECAQVKCGLADPVTLLLAGGVVGDNLVDGPNIGLQLATVVQLEQQLADVIGALRHPSQRRIPVERQDLACLAPSRRSAVASW